MKTEQDIIKQLHSMQDSIMPSERLVKRIALLQRQLPEERYRNSFSWMMLHTGIVVSTILLFIIGIGSGIVVAAAHSQPGGLLFPVKKAFVEAEMHFVSDPSKKQQLQQQLLNKVLVPTPSQVLLQLQKPTPTPATEENKKQDKSINQENNNRKSVDGDSVTPTPNAIQGEMEQKNNHNKNSENNHASHTEQNNFFQYFFQHFENQGDNK